MEEMVEGEVIGLVCVPDRPLLLLLQLGPAVLVEGERDNGGQQEIMSHNKEDQMDDMQQRSLTGSFIITSKANDALESMITPEKDLKEPLVSHVQTLTLSKLNVTLPQQDIRSCRYLQDGSIMLTLANLQPNSAFEMMVAEIKNPSPERRKANMYFNVMLTRRRNSLLYEVRRLKRDGEVFKYWTDFDGTITLKKDEGGLKTRLTSITTRKDFNVRTYTVREVVSSWSDGHTRLVWSTQFSRNGNLSHGYASLGDHSSFSKLMRSNTTESQIFMK